MAEGRRSEIIGSVLGYVKLEVVLRCINGGKTSPELTGESLDSRHEFLSRMKIHSELWVKMKSSGERKDLGRKGWRHEEFQHLMKEDEPEKEPEKEYSTKKGEN